MGEGDKALEVVLAKAESKPSRTSLQSAWQSRRGKRLGTPVLLVVLHNGVASICGYTGESPLVFFDKDVSMIERLCREVLGQPDRHAAQRFLSQALPSLEASLPGIHNVGLLALHELINGVPNRKDWKSAGKKAKNTLGKQDKELLKSLGFKIEKLDSKASILYGEKTRTALAVMLKKNESPDSTSDRFNLLSPVSYAIQKADDENIDWVIVTQGNQIWLYSSKIMAGVGHRGRTDTYIECQTSLLSSEHLPLLWLLYSAEALKKDGSLSQILDSSRRFSGELAAELRDRIYEKVVPTLAKGIAKARQKKDLNAQDLEMTYQMALTILFRLLFIAYAEDRDLLPYNSSETYRENSLKNKAQELVKLDASVKAGEKGYSYWIETTKLWNAVAKGHQEWNVNAHGGGLFSEDENILKAGFEIAKIELPNTIFIEVLKELLLVKTKEAPLGPIDFRSLGVREFGTIYEGLLESELAVADIDLALDKKNKQNIFVPCADGQEPKVKKGEIYLHNKSGARKSSGSYYTKPFAVQHLIERSLEPALYEHFGRLNDLSDVDASEAFFDFRVADIAMGSGHFLIEAIDYIEKGMSKYLSERKLPVIKREIDKLRSVANERLDQTGQNVQIEDGQLLRRLIAKRCIYGVDINLLSVNLARLAVWIHTFVPGLPLSYLDRTLVHGNSLVGVGTFDELTDHAERLEVDIPLLTELKKFMPSKDVIDDLERLAKINDTSLVEIEKNRVALKKIKEKMLPIIGLFDIITARPTTESTEINTFPFENWKDILNHVDTHKAVLAAQNELKDLHPIHFMIEWPEVFISRERKGFDVIIGNPPWKLARIAENAFWSRHFPGFRGLPQRDEEKQREMYKRTYPDLLEMYEKELKVMGRLRKILVNGPYTGMSTGNADMYKAFCWRFWRLIVKDGGKIGVVLPRTILINQGSSPFRQEVFSQADKIEVTVLTNHKEWAFNGVTNRYSIILLSVSRNDRGKGKLSISGPFYSKLEYENGIKNNLVTFDLENVLKWSNEAIIPNLSDKISAGIFIKMNSHPSIEQLKIKGGGAQQENWSVHPLRELDATLQKPLMQFKQSNRQPNFTQQHKKT